MNIACFFGILIIVMGEASVIEKSNNKADIGQKILLRKLQNFQNAPRDEVKSVTWNEILADVLVKKIKIFSFISSDDSLSVAEESKGNILKESISQILALYKVVYDKFKTNDVSISQPAEHPKKQFEVIEPRVGRETCDECEDAASEINADCPKGQVKNKDGNCEDVKPSKMIFAVPLQCPIGYRADRLGFCRIRF